jgi:hypothetical protein
VGETVVGGTRHDARLVARSEEALGSRERLAFECLEPGSGAGLSVEETRSCR